MSSASSAIHIVGGLVTSTPKKVDVHKGTQLTCALLDSACMQHMEVKALMIFIEKVKHTFPTLAQAVHTPVCKLEILVHIYTFLAVFRITFKHSSNQ